MADILIKNIEIPRNTPSRIYLFPNGTVNLNGEDIDAKAIELPPHGRLGDLDALERKVIEEADYPSYEWSRAIDQIRNEPTVLEASNGTDN